MKTASLFETSKSGNPVVAFLLLPLVLPVMIFATTFYLLYDLKQWIVNLFSRREKPQFSFDSHGRIRPVQRKTGMVAQTPDAVAGVDVDPSALELEAQHQPNQSWRTVPTRARGIDRSTPLGRYQL